MEILVLNAADVRAACPMRDAIHAVSVGFRALSGGAALIPLRMHLPFGERNDLLLMPALIDSIPFASVKVVSVVGDNRQRGLPSINSMLLLVDRRSGVPVAILEGASLTALRTGAAGGLAASLLARDDAVVVALYGAGVQARSQLEAVALVRPVAEVRIVARTRASAETFIGSAIGTCTASMVVSDRSAARGADIVVCATSAITPVFDARELGAGTHVTGVGSYRPDMIEIPPEAFREARVVVDQRSAALDEAGDLIAAVSAHFIKADDVLEIGDPATRRTSRDERTIFKSVGNGVQDLAVAERVYARALAAGLGTWIRL